MCGIAGIYSRSDRSDLRESVEAMMDSLKHRGPDDQGTHIGERIGLAHTRLSIQDLSLAGSQPMVAENGRYVLVYNGELYNTAALKAELLQVGQQFNSSSDTEVLLKALIVWGRDALKRLNGMFAFAFWDKQQRQLWLARDRFGIKPLYYQSDEKGFVFGSEIKALIAGNGGSGSRNSISRQGFVEYLLYGAALGEETLFSAYKQLLPGHLLVAGDSGITSITPFWTLADIEPVTHSEPEAVERISALLDSSVKRHLISDVPVGLFLSGGLDSSTLCAIAAESSPEQLNAYSVEFEGDTAHSELDRASEVAKATGVSHKIIKLGYGNLEDNLSRIVDAHDQPFGDVASMPLLLLTDALDSEKVVLQGDGGDEIFSGYRRYQMLQQAQYWRWLKRLVPMPQAICGKSISAQRIKRLTQALGHTNGAERNAWLLTEDTPYDNGLHHLLENTEADWRGGDPTQRYKQLWEQTRHMSASQAMLYTDAQILLPDVFLPKVDRSTMANGIEVRVPFLDTELTDYVMGLPASVKCGNPSKKLLRQAMRNRLPASVTSGPKYGFGVPYAEWLRGPLQPMLREHLLDPSGFIGSMFDLSAITKMCDDHVCGRKNKSFLLYKLLMLSIWASRYSVDHA